MPPRFMFVSRRGTGAPLSPPWPGAWTLDDQGNPPPATWTAWRLVGSNNRELGRSFSVFRGLDSCLTALDRFRDSAPERSSRHLARSARRHLGVAPRRRRPSGRGERPGLPPPARVHLQLRPVLRCPAGRGGVPPGSPGRRLVTLLDTAPAPEPYGLGRGLRRRARAGAASTARRTGCSAGVLRGSGLVVLAIMPLVGVFLAVRALQALKVAGPSFLTTQALGAGLGQLRHRGGASSARC